MFDVIGLNHASMPLLHWVDPWNLKQKLILEHPVSFYGRDYILAVYQSLYIALNGSDRQSLETG